MTVLLGLWCAVAAAEQAPTDARLGEAQRAFDEGNNLMWAGQYAKAVSRYEHALELNEAALGGMHPQVADFLHLLGAVHRREGFYVRAAPLYERALAIRQAALGPEHPEVATLLNAIALLWMDQGQYARAEALAERALAIQQEVLGRSHLDVAHSLDTLSRIATSQGQYARAEQLGLRAMSIRLVALGPNHPDVGKSYNTLADLYGKQGLSSRAQPFREHAQAIAQQAPPPSLPLAAPTVKTYVGLYSSIEPESFMQVELQDVRSLMLREMGLGKDHPDLLVLDNFDQGQSAQAEALFQSALAMQEESRGKEHPSIALTLEVLAATQLLQGQYARAEPLHARALAIRETALGPDHPLVATTLHNLALLSFTQGHYARAQPLMERALAIQEAAQGKDHPRVAALLNNLGFLHACQGQYARARPLLERALAIQEAAQGKGHPDVATTLNTLANVYFNQGEHARAEALLEQALALWEPSAFRSHPNVRFTLYRLAEFRLARQGLAEALPLLERAVTHSEQDLRQQAFAHSERYLAGVLQLRRFEEDFLYTLVRAHPDNPQVRHLAVSTTLLRKSRSSEELAATSRSIYRGLEEEDRQLFEQLRRLRTELATLSLAGPGRSALAAYEECLKALAEQGHVLEAHLARRSEPLRALWAQPPPTELVGQVAAALPPDGALVEFVAYHERPVEPRYGSPVWRARGELRYLALLLFPDGRTEVVDLGPAAAVDAAAQHLQEALARRAVTYQPAAEALHALAFRPLPPRLGTVQRLFLAPDGQLSLVPFAALHDGQRFLVEDWDFTYLTSGKDLLRRSEASVPRHSVVVLADPDFRARLAPGAAAEQNALAERSGSLLGFFSALREGGGTPAWKSLPGTRQEALAIRRLLPQTRLLMGRAATKEALLKLETPGVLHIATHGFFLEDASAEEGTRAVFKPGLVNLDRPRSAPDPLLRSGLVLAGARAPQAGGPSRPEDALVTALELAGMNLWGTQLVVLSGCETGRGDVKLGQGVYGLRRALVVAGAETVVTSLWKVNDETTGALMKGYYRQLLAGQGRATALREAMKALRKKKPHPYYWAPFIAIGQDAPLRGLVQADTAQPVP
jgi:CHAT domain-containing protein/tetratricopeptide (TPR) repeat protein